MTGSLPICMPFRKTTAKQFSDDAFAKEIATSMSDRQKVGKFRMDDRYGQMTLLGAKC